VTAAGRGVAGEATSGPALALAGATKSFASPAGVRRVLAGLDLELAPGEIVAVAGRSGSGKTTLLTMVAGWERPDAGSVVVLGNEASAAGPAWSHVALVPQSLGLLEELTVAENVTLPARLGTSRSGGDGGSSGDPVGVMRRLAIGHLGSRYPSEVSLGEQQRTAVARAVVVRPRLLLADEPIAHQDDRRADAVMATLRRLADDGAACVVATHNALAFEWADRVLELHDGRLRPPAG
jgi:putative ABC transport system ATP-binding protein